MVDPNASEKEQEHCTEDQYNTRSIATTPNRIFSSCLLSSFNGNIYLLWPYILYLILHFPVTDPLKNFPSPVRSSDTVSSFLL